MMMGYSNNKSAVPRLSQEQNDAISATSFARMRENATKKIRSFEAKLTPSQRVAYNALDPIARGMVALSGRMPMGEKDLPQTTKESIKQGGVQGGKRGVKNLIPLDTLLKAIGSDELSARAIYTRGQTGGGHIAIRLACEAYVNAGHLIKRVSGNATRYRVKAVG